jgi:hypothetical protein
MSDYIALIEQDLVDAARRRANVRRLPARRSRRSLLLAAALALIVAGSAMAGTLYVLRGSPIPAPEERDAGPAQTVAPGTSVVLPLRADDPAGGPPFAMRIARSRTGLICATVGQIEGGDFGLVGLDRRFRPLAEGAVDSCGERRDNAASLVGARVLDADRRADVRTVVSGIAGPNLRSAQVRTGATTRTLELGPGGTFISVIRGYPEDVGVRVRLRFADGHVESEPFGTSSFVVLDPLGGPAWQPQGISFSGFPVQCVGFGSARARRTLTASPLVCGRHPDPRKPPTGWFFAVRRLERTRGGGGAFAARGHWRTAPRTAVWGQASEEVREVAITGPGGRRPVPITPGRTFLAVYPPTVDPASLRVELLLANGQRRTYRGDTNLVPPPDVGGRRP